MVPNRATHHILGLGTNRLSALDLHAVYIALITPRKKIIINQKISKENLNACHAVLNRYNVINLSYC